MTEASDSTSSSLLERIRRWDAEAWRRLVDVYGPLIFHWCRSFGLQHGDIADVMQESFVSVMKGIAKFQKGDPGESFRGWLHSIVRSRAIDHFRRKAKQPGGDGGSSALRRLENLAESALDVTPESERSLVIHAALDAIRPEFQPSTWQAFWRVTVNGESATDVASDLGLTASAVRQANYRVRKRLREELNGLWPPGEEESLDVP